MTFTFEIRVSAKFTVPVLCLMEAENTYISRLRSIVATACSRLIYGLFSHMHRHLGSDDGSLAYRSP